jgi:hypothetical protein
MPRSLAITPSAGESMDDDSGVTNEKPEAMKVIIHLRRMDQFRGFAGSVGPSHVTCHCI